MDKLTELRKFMEKAHGPPRPGLVPQSGDPRHPVRWVRPEDVKPQQKPGGGAPPMGGGKPKRHEGQPNWDSPEAESMVGEFADRAAAAEQRPQQPMGGGKPPMSSGSRKVPRGKPTGAEPINEQQGKVLQAALKLLDRNFRGGLPPDKVKFAAAGLWDNVEAVRQNFKSREHFADAVHRMYEEVEGQKLQEAEALGRKVRSGPSQEMRMLKGLAEMNKRMKK